MKTYEFPRAIKTYFQELSISAVKYFVKHFSVIARCFVNTPEPVFPKRIDKKLCFPVGKFWTALTTPEIELGLKKGYIKKVKDIIIYHKAPIFVDYVNYFYQKRQEYRNKGDKSFSYLCKLLLNSLYGKWGQLNDVFVKVDYDENMEDGYYSYWDVVRQQNVHRRVINGVIEESIGKEEAFNSFPAISAHITSFARLLLYNYIKQAGFNNVYYCDTDSLFCNEKGYQNLKPYISRTELGKLKLVKSANILNIRGLKDYKFGTDEKIKGIKSNAIKIGDKEYKQVQFEGLKSGLQCHNLSSVIVKEVIKTIKREYTKGRVLPSGKVKPFELCENP